jgi:PAS domain S-box-containing protein
MQDARKTVLLVEDEAIIALAESNQLKQAGYGVLQAFTGEKAIESARSASDGIDLILMDIDLGKGMDGTEAARRILENRDVPILFLSSHMEPELVGKTEEISGYGYVAKNSPFTILDASIKMALRLFHAKRQINLNRQELETANANLRVLAANLEKSNRELENTNGRLAFSEEKYEKLFQTNPDYITISDLADGTFIEVNEGFCRITGYSRDEVIGHSALDDDITLWVYPSERQGLEVLLRERGEVRDYEATMRRKNGEHFIAETSSRVIDIGDKKAFIGVVKDVTEREGLIKELHEREERFNLVMEVTNDGIWDYDFVSDNMYVSPSYREMFGYGRDERIEPRRVRDLVHPEDRAFAIATFRDCIEGRIPQFDIEFRITTKHDARKWIRTRAKVVKRGPQGEASRIIGTCIDITEKKEIESRKDLEYRLNAALMDNIPDTIYFKDLEGRFVRVNKAYLDRRGLANPDEAVGMTDFDMFSYESALLSKKDDDTVLSTGKALRIPDEKRTWADGTTNHFSVIKMPHFDESGRIIGLFGISRDITAEKEQEEALRESRQRYDDLLNSIGEGFVALDAEEVFLEANPAAERIFGLEHGALVGRSLFDFLDDEGKKITEEQVMKNRSKLLATEYVSPIIKGDGQKRWLLVNSQPISKTQGIYCGSVSVIRDISEGIAARKELTALVEKKELLMKELQHRVKNTLTLVSSILQLSKGELDDEKSISTIEEAQTRIVAMSKIYEQLYLTESVESLDFGLYLRNLANGIFETYSSLVPKVDLSIKSPSTHIDTKRAISLGLIVNELLTNAIKHAFSPDKGGHIAVGFSVDGNRAVLVVSDDGKGFGNLESLASSTTLGMQLVQVLVEQIEGTLSIESSKGTNISVAFDMNRPGSIGEPSS